MRLVSVLVILSMGLILCSCTDLYLSAKSGDIVGIEKALNAGIGIDKEYGKGNTAIIVAACNDQAEAVEYLCKNGADVNAQGERKCTALHMAAYYNFFDVAKVLVENGADKTIQDVYGKTPYDYANDFEYTGMMALLSDN